MKKSKLDSKMKKDGEFIPPDGGWGWMIIFAAGFSNLSALPVFQQFGLLFRDKLSRLGINSSQTTTLINMHSALNSCVGLANGPVFKTFSYRQVSLTGSLLVFGALLMTTFSNNFSTYLVSFSIIYGAGYGIIASSNALALNTYWKKRRRLATGLSWTTTGLGPMLWPHIITICFAYFGESGTILLLSGFSLHAVACALLLQPVEWHTKSPNENSIEEEKLLNQVNNQNKSKLMYSRSLSKLKTLSAFSSQYLYNEDDPEHPGYEITDPGVPMLVRANDGYFSQSRQLRRFPSGDGSIKNSLLKSKKPSMTNLLNKDSQKTSTLFLNESKKNSSANLSQERDIEKPKSKVSVTLPTLIPESEIEDCPTLKAPQDLKAEGKAVINEIDPERVKYIADKDRQHIANSKSLKDNHSNVSLKSNLESEEKKNLKDNQSNQSHCMHTRKKSNHFNYENQVLKQASLKLEKEYLKETDEKESERPKFLIHSPSEDDMFVEKENKTEEEKEPNNQMAVEQLTFCQKIYLFFDFDLLKDFSFINLMMGVTLAGFSETNFSLLTPFILGDYGMTKSEISLFMSLLAGVDLSIRFCIPFIAGKIGWHNNSFYLFGVLSMATGRIILAYSQNYTVVLAVAVLIGFGKGLRTVFMALVIPTYVPLHKLPGASGLQLLSNGIVCLTIGPVVGWIKDHASTAVTLHCLNIFTFLTAISWTTEKYLTNRKQKLVESDEIISKTV